MSLLSHSHCQSVTIQYVVLECHKELKRFKIFKKWKPRGFDNKVCNVYSSIKFRQLEHLDFCCHLKKNSSKNLFSAKVVQILCAHVLVIKAAFQVSFITTTSAYIIKPIILLKSPEGIFLPYLLNHFHVWHSSHRTRL